MEEIRKIEARWRTFMESSRDVGGMPVHQFFFDILDDIKEVIDKRDIKLVQKRVK